jgi:hypothetical protein
MLFRDDPRTSMNRPVLLALLGALATGLAHGASDAALRACRTISADAARLACFDRLVDGTAEPAAAAASAAAPAPPQPTPEQLFGRDAAESEAIVRQSAGIGRAQELSLTVTAWRAGAHDKAEVTFSNGQVWQQLDSPLARLKPGDQVVIRRAAFGSYLMTRPGGGRSIRMRRIDGVD